MPPTVSLYHRLGPGFVVEGRARLVIEIRNETLDRLKLYMGYAVAGHGIDLGDWRPAVVRSRVEGAQMGPEPMYTTSDRFAVDVAGAQIRIRPGARLLQAVELPILVCPRAAAAVFVSVGGHVDWYRLVYSAGWDAISDKVEMDTVDFEPVPVGRIVVGPIPHPKQ